MGFGAEGLGFMAQDPAKRQVRRVHSFPEVVCGLEAEGSKDSCLKAFGPKDHTIKGFWAILSGRVRERMMGLS